MTDAPHDTEPPETPEHKRHDWSRSGAIGTWANVGVAAVGVIVAIVVPIALSHQGSSGVSTTSSTPVAAPTAASSTAGAPVSTPVVGPGTCLSGSTVVPCANTHTHEVVAAGRCSDDAALTFLGGTPGLDVTAPSVHAAITSVAGTAVCVVSVQDRSLTGSLHQALATSRGDEIRWCRNVRHGVADVPCTQNHDEEVFGTSSSTAECVTKAGDFLGGISVPDKLNVASVKIGGHPHCTLSAIDPEKLTKSLRAIGDDALPLTVP